MIPNEDEYYMSLALKQAERALEEEEIPVGAVVVCQGKSWRKLTTKPRF